MYDDYDFKLTNKRLRFKFIQEVDGHIFPWEAARFINDLNTSYYKIELLNSISTALNNGVDPKNIIILSKSLPLHKDFTNLDILDVEKNGLSFIYEIGEVFSLVPNQEISELSLSLELFRSFNKRLYHANYQPLSLSKITNLYSAICSRGIDQTPQVMLDIVSVRSKKGKELPSFEHSIKTFKSKLSNLITEYELSRKIDPINTAPKNFPKGLPKNFFNKFFFLFNKLHRPVVLLKEGKKFRVLARGIVNKVNPDARGLELIEMPRNSPLGAILEGGVAAYRAIHDEKRAREVHQLDIELKRLQIEKAQNEKMISAQKLKQEELKTEILAYRALNDIVRNSDVKANELLGNSYHERNIAKLYSSVDSQLSSTIHGKGFCLDPKETRIIDIKV